MTRCPPRPPRPARTPGTTPIPATPFSGNYTDIGVESGNSSGHGDSTDSDQTSGSLSTSSYQDSYNNNGNDYDGSYNNTGHSTTVETSTSTMTDGSAFAGQDSDHSTADYTYSGDGLVGTYLDIDKRPRCHYQRGFLE